MAEVLLQAQQREKTGKGNAKKMRKLGKVPGVFYAHNEKSILIQLNEIELIKVLSAKTGLIDIKIEDKRKRKAIIKEAQTDPVKQTINHVDIMGVRLKEKVIVTVPIHVIGEAVGVKEQGGILHQSLREIEVSCLPLDIPEYIEIDVTNLKIGDSLTVEQLAAENVALLLDADQSIVSVLAPTIAKEEKEEEEIIAEEELEEEETSEHSDD
ncbi:MAG TPA: 50S ribosomal protein L25 [bacterium]|nr:50S ribosomal protein L25 [bacterium]